MVFINTDAISRRVEEMGLNITITHYTGKTTFSEESQTPSRCSVTIKTKATNLKPKTAFIENTSGTGRTTISDKRIMLSPGILISVGDKIKYDVCDTIKYEVKEVSKPQIGKFVNKIIATIEKVE